MEPEQLLANDPHRRSRSSGYSTSPRTSTIGPHRPDSGTFTGVVTTALRARRGSRMSASAIWLSMAMASVRRLRLKIDHCHRQDRARPRSATARMIMGAIRLLLSGRAWPFRPGPERAVPGRRRWPGATPPRTARLRQSVPGLRAVGSYRYLRGAGCNPRTSGARRFGCRAPRRHARPPAPGSATRLLALSHLTSNF